MDVHGQQHEVLVNCLGGLSLPRKSVVRLHMSCHPDMTTAVYRGCKTTTQQQLLVNTPLTLKVPITTAADGILKYFSLFFFFFFFSEKIRHDISGESSAKHRIHMKHQALFSSKDKSESVVC